MKKEDKLQLVGLEDIARHPEIINYMDENIAIIDNFSQIIEPDTEAVKLDCLMIVFCQEGSLILPINGDEHLLQKGYCAILPLGSVLRRAIVKQAYTLKIAAASPAFLHTTLAKNKATWDIMTYLFKHPVFPVKQNNSYKLYLYKELLVLLGQEKQHAFSKQTRHFHIAGMLCEMIAELHKTILEKNHLSITYNRGITITHEFMSLVHADNGSHRSVSYYADRLFYTAKYLSTVIKQTTGKTPLKIINEHAIKEIRHQLKYSNMRMKEMATFFGFPNPSFFAKFVKAHTGMTPQQIRMSEEEKE